MITVTICDPYELWRKGLRQILSKERDIVIADDVEDFERLLPSIKKLQPEVVL